MDTFGRPAVDWQSFRLQDNRQTSNLSNTWRFRVDPKNIGVGQKWFATATEFSEWDKIEVPKFWKNHLKGNYNGYAWYATTFSAPQGLTKESPLHLEFNGVDEQAWVFLNGHYLGEHTVQSTGQSPAELWDEPFSFTLPKKRLENKNILVVRVNNKAQNGGIYKPVRLQWTK